MFYELIHSGMVSVTVLDWIFRQSKDGLIAYNAKFINEGSTKLYYGNDFVFVDSPTQIETARRIQDIYCKEAAERGIENVQILSPFREKERQPPNSSTEPFGNGSTRFARPRKK